MNKIIVFTLNGCFYCNHLKERLTSMSIPFTEVEVTKNPKIWDQVLKQTGHDAFPTVFIRQEGTDNGPVFIPGKHFENEDELIELIKKHI